MGGLSLADVRAYLAAVAADPRQDSWLGSFVDSEPTFLSSRRTTPRRSRSTACPRCGPGTWACTCRSPRPSGRRCTGHVAVMAATVDFCFDELSRDPRRGRARCPQRADRHQERGGRVPRAARDRPARQARLARGLHARGVRGERCTGTPRRRRRASRRVARGRRPYEPGAASPDVAAAAPGTGSLAGAWLSRTASAERARRRRPTTTSCRTCPDRPDDRREPTMTEVLTRPTSLAPHLNPARWPVAHRHLTTKVARGVRARAPARAGPRARRLPRDAGRGGLPVPSPAAGAGALGDRGVLGDAHGSTANPPSATRRAGARAPAAAADPRRAARGVTWRSRPRRWPPPRSRRTTVARRRPLCTWTCRPSSAP